MSDNIMPDTNNVIPEESCVVVIDGESTNKNALKHNTKDQKEVENRQTIADYFRFVEMVEETKMLEKYKRDRNKPCFVKEFKVVKKEDWTENHFFYNDGEEKDECKVFFTSYQVKRVIENSSRADFYSEEKPIEVNKSKENAGFYYIQAQKPCNVVPVPSIPQEGEVHEFLKYYKEEREKRISFDENSTLEDVLESACEEGFKMDPEVSQFAKTYHKALVDRDLKVMFKPLYDWQGGNLDKSLYELRLGLGHVRKIYQKKNGEKRILNAPLIEVPVEVDEEFLKVVPVQGGRLKWNAEAKDVLLYTGGKNKKVLSDFQTLIANSDPMKVVLGDPRTFLKYVKKASKFCWDDVVKEPTDDSLHTFPENSEASVLTTEWCVFVRRKRSNTISSDAHAIAKAIEETKLNLSPPCRSLVLGSDNVRPKYSESAVDSSSFALPLSVSKCQLEVIKNVFSKDNHVSIIQGPPGTGKTQTGVNIASIVLQKGLNCLVTSDNPQALEAFEQKLPQKLSKFCINMSTMQEDGIGKLSQSLDRMEADLSALLEGTNSYRKEMEMLKENIDGMKSNRKTCIEKLKKHSRINRAFMKESNFKKLVQRGLRRDTKSCPYVKSILQHEALDGLRTDLTNLSNDKRVEIREPISFTYNDSDNVTQDLIDWVKKKATPGLHFRELPPKPHRGMVSSFKLDTHYPDKKDDWVRVLRGLKLKKTMSDFQKFHVKSLEEKGCPKTFIYTDDGAVSQGFVDAVIDIHDSVKESEGDERGILLKVLEDVSINRKSQEAVRGLTVRIRQLEEELSYATIARNQRESITGLDLGNFSQLKELASRMKDSEIDATKGSDAILRRKAKFADKFRKSLGCIPLLLMTTEQVSRYIPVDHRFGMVIADEASQSSSSTALTILARAEQAVVIGDTKQALPKDDLKEESRNALDKCKGELSLADLFMPGDGNGLFDVCLAQFAFSHKTLRDHFRCPPDGVSWSNNEMYAEQLRTYKPSGTIATQCLKIVTKDCEEDMVQFVYGKVEKSLSSGIDNHPVPTIGVIMMGSKGEAKSFKKLLEDKLVDLENQYGTEAVDRHSIKIAPPDEFQSQEKDIILIGCLLDNGKVPHDTDPHRKRLWNVATTRHKRLSVIFSSYDPKKIKKGDPKQKIFFQYRTGQSNASISDFKKGNHDVRSMSEDLLFDQLLFCGYDISRNRALIWKDCLSIGLRNGSISDNNALIMIENYGETTDEWLKVVDEQAELEETGTSCLRVDALALSLCFHGVFDDVKAFLKNKAGLSPVTHEVSDDSDKESPCSSKPKKRSASKTSARSSKRGKKSL